MYFIVYGSVDSFHIQYFTDLRCLLYCIKYSLYFYAWFNHCQFLVTRCNHFCMPLPPFDFVVDILKSTLITLPKYFIFSNEHVHFQFDTLKQFDRESKTKTNCENIVLFIISEISPCKFRNLLVNCKHTQQLLADEYWNITSLFKIISNELLSRWFICVIISKCYTVYK